jgi:uncharacterized Tic20 family protein
VALALIVPGIGGWAGPLAVRLTKGKESKFVEDNATEALNYGILVSAVQLVVSAITGGGAVLGGGGGSSIADVFPFLGRTASLIPLLIVLAALVLPGLAALRANDGKLAVYPEFLPRIIRPSEEDEETKA